MYSIAAFYQFSPVADPDAIRGKILEKARELDIQGTVLVAAEGLNGTVASQENTTVFVDFLRTFPGFETLDTKISHSPDAPFKRLSVRLKEEIVALGIPGIDPRERVGTYVPPQEWDALIAQDDVLVIDCRNSYEFDVGTFEGAVDPGVDTFRDFPEYARNLDPAEHPRVAMFCTGGIRCEKATGLMLDLGFKDVYHLQGGILRYLEERGAGPNTWEGDCFVFDRRVAVDPLMQPAEWDVCWACRMPVGPHEKASPHFEEGVSCARCFNDWTDEERAAKRLRHAQLA